MSGYVPKRVSNTRTAMGSTDQNSSGENGLSIISTIGRRSTLLRQLQTRSFGSMLQINYARETNKCARENLVPQRSYSTLTIPKAGNVTLEIFRDGFTSGFVRKSLQNALVTLHGGNVYTDSKCSFGSINNNVSNNIVLGAGTYGSAPKSLPVGKSIIGIERWMTGSTWDITFPTALVVGYSGTGLGATTAPTLTVNGAVYLPTEFETTPSTTWGGVNIGDFQIVRYGNGSTTAETNLFGAISAGGSTSMTISFS